MGDYDFGPQWVWTCGCIMAVIGFIACLVLAVMGIVWLFNHVQIT